MWGWPAVAALGLSFVAVAPAVIAQPAEIARITLCRGPWTIDGRPAHAGDRVYGGSVLRFAGARAAATQEIALVFAGDARIGNATVRRFACRASDPCAHVTALPKNVAAPVAWYRYWSDAFAALPIVPHRRTEQASSRGIVEEFLPDGVVALDGARVDLQPLVGGVAPGDYAVRFVALGTSGASAEVRWSSGVPGRAVPAPGVRPALYDVTLYHADDRRHPASNTARVLVVTRARFPVAAEFLRQAQLTAVADGDGWTADDGTRFVRSVLQAMAKG